VIGGTHIETTSPQFVRAMAAQLRSARGRRPVVLLVRRSRGRFRRRDLRDAEAGLLPLDLDTVTALAATYGITVDGLLPSRRSRLLVRPEGLICAGGRTVPFEAGDAGSLVASFIRLLQVVRDDDGGEVTPRDDDVRTVASFLDDAELGIVERDAVIRTLDQPSTDQLALVDQVLSAVEAHRRPSTARRQA
jgi:hypothetical protein